MALGVTSEGLAVLPVTFALTVPAAILARYALVILPVGSAMFTAVPTVFAVKGELAVTL